MKKVSLFIALLTTGLLAGAFYYGTFLLIPTFYELPVAVHLRCRVELMGHNVIYMQLLTLTAILSSIWVAVVSRRIYIVRNYAIAAATAALISILITRFGNVPVNHIMRIWDKTGAPPNWEKLLAAWNAYNYLRTAFAFASFGLIIITSLKITKNINNEYK